MRKTLPFLKEEYFANHEIKTLFSTIHSYVEEYNCCPTPTALTLAVNALPLKEQELKTITDLITEISPKSESQRIEWLMDETEKFCKEKALDNALLDCILISRGKHKKYKKDAIPELLREALATGFDMNVGHDYLNDLETRYKFYHEDTERIPFAIEMMNRYTRGGMPRKTLCMAFAPPGGGKSIFLCDHAANCLRRGFNVLYVTLEMAEARIAERIDANLLNISLDDLFSLPYDVYQKKFDKFRETCKSRLMIKEYAPTGTTAQTIRSLVEELKIKKQFVPDVIVVDYLTICESFRFSTGNTNSFERYKAVAEELRSLGKYTNTSVISAGQIQRNAYKNTDADMEHVAESAGINNTADVMFFIISSEEMDELDQCMWKITKNRLGRKDATTKFIVGIDKDKMRFFDVNATAQQSVVHNKSTEKTSSPFASVADDDEELMKATLKLTDKTANWS